MEKVLRTISDFPHQTLAFVFDVDGTMIQKYVDGTEVPSLISILRNENILNDVYTEKAKDLKNMYHSLEINPELSYEEKSIKMEEWWQKHKDLLIEHKLTKNHIHQAVNHPSILLRDGVKEIFDYAHKYAIPVIIFSASGIGIDSITYLLERFNLQSSNVHIVTNRFEYEGVLLTKSIPPLIHTLNKNESVLIFFPEIKQILLSRENVILFGDLPHDADMVDNKNHKNVIRVGLLNEQDLEKKNKFLPLFHEKFDIVIEDDGSLENILESFQENASSFSN